MLPFFLIIACHFPRCGLLESNVTFIPACLQQLNDINFQTESGTYKTCSGWTIFEDQFTTADQVIFPIPSTVEFLHSPAKTVDFSWSVLVSEK